MVVLDETLLRREAERVLPLGAEGLAEEPALVAVHHRLDRDEARELGSNRAHRGKRGTVAYIRRGMGAGAGDQPPKTEPPAAVWPAGPADPALPEDSVDVWQVDLTTLDAQVLGLLSGAECRRAAQIPDERRRRLWQGSRGVLRALLGRYLAI